MAGGGILRDLAPYRYTGVGCVLTKLLFSLKFSVFSLIMWLVSLVTIPLYLQISTLMSSKIIHDIS